MFSAWDTTGIGGTRGMIYSPPQGGVGAGEAPDADRPFLPPSQSVHPAKFTIHAGAQFRTSHNEPHPRKASAPRMRSTSMV